MENILTVNNIEKYYGGKSNITKAIDNISFTIDKGEFVFVIGTTGSGKSTFIKLLYREETPSNGVVTIGNVNVANLPNYKVPNLRRCMGIVFQDYKLLHNQSVYDNVAYVIRTLGYSSREIEARVLGALKIVDLDNKIKAKASELSGGEQQSVSIVNGPPLLIADEPTGNLDPKNSLEIMQILEQINLKGITLIISTHDKAMVNHFRKRVITLQNGEIVRDELGGTYE